MGPQTIGFTHCVLELSNFPTWPILTAASLPISLKQTKKRVKEIWKLVLKADLGTDTVNVWHCLDISSVGLVSVGGFLPNDKGCLQLSLTEFIWQHRRIKKMMDDSDELFNRKLKSKKPKPHFPRWLQSLTLTHWCFVRIHAPEHDLHLDSGHTGKLVYVTSAHYKMLLVEAIISSICLLRYIFSD